jgi:hypothetical protein
MTNIKPMAIVGAVLLGAAACGGSNQVPAQELARSESSIRGASQAGAQNYPEAASRLAVAKDTVARAQKVAKDGNIDAAKALLNDASADADLALALTHSKDAEAKRNTAEQKLQGLQ